MRDLSPIRYGLVAVLCGLLGYAMPTVASTTPSMNSAKGAGTSSSKASTRKGKHSRSKTKGKSLKKRGQKAIDSERTQQIQQALIREHYLSGTPSGKWDDATQAALRRYQADQGWQSKTVPDSRALIKLGLGPSHDHLLNPESAMTTAPVAVDSKARNKAPASDPPKAPAASTPVQAGVPQQ